VVGDGLGRRRLLRGLGVAAAVPLLGSGAAAAAGGPSSGRGREDPPGRARGAPLTIDPVLGLTLLDARESFPPQIRPDHVVTMGVIPPSDGEDIQFFYEPTGLSVDPGDVVQFVFTNIHHNVVGYVAEHARQSRVPAGVPPFSSPLLGAVPDSDLSNPFDWAAPASWFYRFTTPGVYNYYCSPHEFLGMSGRIVVGDEGWDADYVDSLAPFPAGPGDFSAAVLSDPNLRPAVVAQEGAVFWDELVALGGSPIDLD
jgi:plastocyanin